MPSFSLKQIPVAVFINLWKTWFMYHFQTFIDIYSVINLLYIYLFILFKENANQLMHSKIKNLKALISINIITIYLVCRWQKLRTLIPRSESWKTARSNFSQESHAYKKVISGVGNMRETILIKIYSVSLGFISDSIRNIFK